ncbi:oligopeptide transport ATP-binding protein OppD [Oxobacter pfennigii]|uniref:Oligopeptide transport ATP-binding protein OppD n=1 Tax=Oxobacter pfennigii TaxID=36849 RepID=A0A0P8Y7G6_9CLOT|nr:ABC transporter ATP-binding protein [Oxobacter pfennigii]KPU42420.1 oligopeptide transport ATP-binding protein OppD [Oxobacter pfennigii]
MGVLLEVNDLKTYFYTMEGIVPAVDGVSFSINKGETLGIVGESGSGKSVAARSIMRLIPSPPGKIINGSIIFNGEDILSKKDKDMREIRGNKIAMIFQDPMTSLNPLFTIGDQIIEAIMIHQKLSKKEAIENAVEMLKLVGIPSPEKRIKDYPHQMSGGMRQRVMIAMALSCRPDLLIADEPTTALDVTIQAQILELISDIKDKFNMSVMIITHDLGVVAGVADKIIVMYAGKLMEYGDVSSIFSSPLHPYTKGLMESVPKIKTEGKRLKSIAGSLPNLTENFKGCRFAERCSMANNMCFLSEPDLTEVDGRQVRCFLYPNGEV